MKTPRPPGHPATPVAPFSYARPTLPSDASEEDRLRAEIAWNSNVTPDRLTPGHVNPSPVAGSGQVKGEPDNNIHYRKCGPDAGEGNPAIQADTGPDCAGHVNTDVDGYSTSLRIKAMCPACSAEALCPMDLAQFQRCAARLWIDGTYRDLDRMCGLPAYPLHYQPHDRGPVVDGIEVYALRWSVCFASGLELHGVDRVFDGAKIARVFDCDAGPSVLWSQPYVWILKDAGDRHRGPSVSIMGRVYGGTFDGFDDRLIQFDGPDTAPACRFLELEGYAFDNDSGNWISGDTWPGWDHLPGNVSTCVSV